MDEVDKLELREVPAFTGVEVSSAAEPHRNQRGQTGHRRVAEKRHVRLTSGELLESREFRHLVARRWKVALLLTLALFVVYYGFILLVATQRDLLAIRVGEVTTLGILLAVAVLVLAWVLTAAYVVWANRNYDPEVQRLRDRLRS
jgi:uncharacterized membrane protein (DUF485 family)